jgi:hypothetical protein
MRYSVAAVVVILCLLLGLAASTYAECLVEPVCNPVVHNLVPLYRLLNPKTGRRLYTTGASERVDVVQNQNFKDEGITGYCSPVQVPDSLPLHRYYNAKLDYHFYTANAAEATTPDYADYKYIGLLLFSCCMYRELTQLYRCSVLCIPK